jgi:2',3'-cyclic-nucleotide 2'-phosphodiesterase (5'-nucleotidase family)
MLFTLTGNKIKFMRYCSIFTIFSLFFLTACKPTRTFLADEKAKTYRIAPSDTLVADPTVEAMIQPYKSSLDGKMNAVIGKCAKELTAGEAVSLLGNWSSQLILNQSIKYYKKNIDFATVNRGGLRIRSLSAGDVTRGKMYELMPFDNALVVITTDSAGIDKFIRHMGNKGGWPIAGASYVINKGVVENIKIGGQILRGGRSYSFVVSDYIADGGDNCDFLKTMKRDNLNKLMRDAFIEGVEDETRNGRVLDAALDNRIDIKN